MKNIISIIVIIISIASFALIVKPGYAEIKDIESKSNEYKEVLANAKKLTSIRDELLEKRDSVSQADLNRLSKLIPDGADNVRLIINLQNIAERHHLTINTASAVKDEEDGAQQQKQTFDIQTKDYGIISLTFDINGDYLDFLDFLSEVEDSLRITDIKQLSIELGDNPREYQFTISLDTYWLKDNI